MVTQTRARETPSFSVIDAIVHKHNAERGAVIPILQEVQATYGYIPPIAIDRIAKITGITNGEIYGTATFYNMFRLEPLGENLVKVCHGTACHLAGAERISESIAIEVGARAGETSPDGKFTIEQVACLGCCSSAPALMINEEIHGHLTPESVRKVLKKCKRKDGDGV
ncbi:NADH-quinone oxidoreductase subunit NuoE [Candidatus Aquicultor secundus]|uniref:NADH-quinone oxidoreductase subunit NuoE n=1 Tax=Candidatus Aquicultor secundus TaxID=1973895 RepID=UPI00257953A5|nr:NADH-quinone oxidoreductase subunit NuoE [Candidatus Aquicultor secundus]